MGFSRPGDPFRSIWDDGFVPAARRRLRTEFVPTAASYSLPAWHENSSSLIRTLALIALADCPVCRAVMVPCGARAVLAERGARIVILNA